MSAPGADALLIGAATVNDALRGLFFESGTVVEFLKADSSNVFTAIDTRSTGWWLEYSNFRHNFLLEIAETDTALGLAETMAEATHVRIGDDIYAIIRRDVTPPNGTDVTWKIYCDKFTKRGSYTVLTG